VQKVFVVEMLRWGERELHSYVQGVYSSEEEAFTAAKEAEEGRGGKYEAEVTMFFIGEGRRQIKVVKRSDKNWWEPIPDEKKLNVGDLVRNIAGEVGKVAQVSEEHLGLADALIVYDDREQWHRMENLEKLLGS